MADVKTQPVKVTFLDEASFWVGGEAFSKGAVAGGVLLDAEREDGEPGVWWYSCPCGCGSVGRLRVGKGFKPTSTPSWEWTGGLDAASLKPSVHDVGHWHGFITDGFWVSC